MRPLQLRVTVPLLAIHYSQMHVRQIPVLVEAHMCAQALGHMMHRLG